MGESYSELHPVKCSVASCDKSFRGSDWHTRQAQKDGWFLQRDGTAWCPEHTPEWVGAWRKRKLQNKEG